MSSNVKLKLRPWLISRIESKEVPGLDWLARDELKFKIPWKHHGKQDWTEADAQIFKEWAMYTGKYREGEEPDYAVWKTRLRCALYKLPDVEEVKVKHEENNCPYRVYRFLTTGPNTLPTPQESLPSFYEQQSIGAGNLPSVLESLESNSFHSKLPSNMSMTSLENRVDTSDLLQAEVDVRTVVQEDGLRDCSMRSLGEQSPRVLAQEPFKESLFELRVYYKDKLHLRQPFLNHPGCVVYWAESPETAPQLPGLMLPLPEPRPSLIEDDAKTVTYLLTALQNGLQLYSDPRNGDLYVQRRCKSRIFYADSDGRPCALARNQPVCLFRLNDFLSQVQERGEGFAGAALSVAQRWHQPHKVIGACVFSITVISVFASTFCETANQNLTSLAFETSTEVPGVEVPME